ncbi:GFA family protein [Pseudoduganella namucuonensis]|uniref:Uncharacterized conserved protein n=1 Tax=Pseudoduganella namucuonensis TaxID=1035707 RepID=A0A1I7JM47_9BURK|nr:GFA family protein [Pseudoduganella namucuonensis]SFU86243.1 Uncharacterized conserved protein [Pseudoduganella namucuonensis]
MHTGGCFCGDLRYEADGAVSHRTNCHCTMCRRVAGAPCVAWFTVARAGFRYTRGAPTRFHSSPGVTRCFCPRCGTHLSFEDHRAQGEIDVTTASLDDPEALPPLDHTHAENQLSWLKLADGLPRFARSRAEGALI